MYTSVKEWCNVLLPTIENEFGPLPQKLNLRVGKPHVRHSNLPWGFYFDPQKNYSYIKVHPANIEKLMYDKKHPDLCKRYLIDALVHEIMHFYNNSALREYLGVPWETMVSGDVYRLNPKNPWNQHWHWLEGSAELAALRIAFLLIENPELDQKITENMFGTQNADNEVHNIQKYTMRKLGNIIWALARKKTISEPKIELIELPFDIPKIMKDKINSRAVKVAGHPYPNLGYNLPYHLGVMRLGKLVSSGQMTISEILQTPISNRALREITR